MERLLCFPQPFPDELLYSLAVRYHRFSANNSYRQTSQELFDTYSRTCGSILPCCLEALSQRLASAYSVDELIDRFTLLPLYKPFVNGTRYSAACMSMAGNSGTGLKMSLGITASGFLKHASFRYCECCITEDTHDCGSPYWHRIHQAIGTCTCPQHGAVLREMTFPGDGDWRSMLLPGEALGSPVIEAQGKFAADTVSGMQLWGLEHPSDAKRLVDERLLRHRLDEMGFLKSGRIKERALKDYLMPRLLCSPAAKEFHEVRESCDWVLALLRSREAVVQPFKFYFLCWLLGMDAEQLQSFRPQPDIFTTEAPRSSDTLSIVNTCEIEAHRAAFSDSSEARCHDKPGYGWLYRHDRAWLAQYVSFHPFPRVSTKLVDWGARDLGLVQDLLAARDKILSAQGKPIRITRAALNRSVAHHNDFLRMPEKFPKSIKLMDGMLESNHDHQTRKIRWAVRHYLLPERTAISVVYRCAGIRRSHVPDEEVLKILSTE